MRAFNSFVLPSVNVPNEGMKAMTTEANLLAWVLSYLKKNGNHGHIVSGNPIFQAVASAAAGILATASPNFATLGPDSPFLDKQLRDWAAGNFETNFIQYPQFTASILLWADTWKHGI